MATDKDSDLLAAWREIVELAENESIDRTAEDWKVLNALLEISLAVTTSPANQARLILQKMGSAVDPSLRLVKKPPKKSSQSPRQPLENEVEHDEKKQAQKTIKELKKAIRAAERS